MSTRPPEDWMVTEVSLLRFVSHIWFQKPILCPFWPGHRNASRSAVWGVYHQTHFFRNPLYSNDLANCPWCINEKEKADERVRSAEVERG